MVGLVNAGMWIPPDDIEAGFGEAVGSQLNRMLGNHEDGDVIPTATKITVQDGGNEGRMAMNKPRIVRQVPA